MKSDTLELWSRGAIGGKGDKPRLLFGSVYEDPRVELAALQRAPSRSEPKRAFCIASGGDTAFALLLSGTQVRAVDINPAQVALCELKVAALESLSDANFERAFQSDARFVLPQLRSGLSPATRAFWNNNEAILQHGLALCGRAEGVFRVGAKGWELYLGRAAVRALFEALTVEEARRVFRSRWQNSRWRLLFRLALHPMLLRLFYARGFLHDLPPAFARRIRRRIESALLKATPATNPFAGVVFRGRYSSDQRGWPLYAQHDNRKLLRSRLGNLSLETGDCARILEASVPGSVEFFALSNVLDAASPAYGERLLHAVARAGAPGALVCLRAISSPPLAAIRATQDLFDNDLGLAEELRSLDTSLFCPLAAVLRVR